MTRFPANESPRRTGLHRSISVKSSFYLPAFEISRSCPPPLSNPPPLYIQYSAYSKQKHTNDLSNEAGHFIFAKGRKDGVFQEGNGAAPLLSPPPIVRNSHGRHKINNCKEARSRTSSLLKPLNSSSTTCQPLRNPRETREGWPLLTLTVETEVNRDSKSTNERGLLCRYLTILSCLGCSTRPNTKYSFSHRTLFQFIFPQRPASWAGCRAG